MDSQNDWAGDSKNKYLKEANELNKTLPRMKRSTERLYFPNNNSVCNLYLKVDPILYKEIYLHEGDGVSKILNCKSISCFYNFLYIGS